MSTPDRGQDEGAAGYPRPFGPYLLLRPLNRGGMGEVYLAKHGKVDGIEKFCVVKTLRRAFTDDDDYVGRFIEEARVVVHLGHRNICHVFDVGKVSERYYLAMELIAGRDLRRVQEAAGEAGRKMPVALALHVAAQLLEALDYAHRHVHPATGEPLGLVHRDVSPQNVMVNLEGEVKLIDFGLAATNLSVEVGSDSGIVIGKLAYMAPEQLEGTAVDAGCDVYSAAVVLYELLTGKRFYEGLPRGEIWDAAKNGWRPAGLAELDAELAALLERALTRRPEDRIGCDALVEQLERYRLARGLSAGARQLRAFMNELFPEEQQAVRAMLRRYAGAGNEWPDEEVEQTTSIARSERTPSLPSLSPEEQTATESIVVSSAGSFEESASETARHLAAEHARRTGVGRAFLAGGAVASVLAALWFLLVPAPTVDAPAPTGDEATTERDGDESASSQAPSLSRAAAEPPPSARTGRDDVARAAVEPSATSPPAASDPASAARPSQTPNNDVAAPKGGVPQSPARPASTTASQQERRAPTTSDDTGPVSTAAARAPTAPREQKGAESDALVDESAAASPAPALDALTFEQKIEYLDTRCRELPCAKPLVDELRGLALSEVSTQRLATAVDDVKRCLSACAKR